MAKRIVTFLVILCLLQPVNSALSKGVQECIHSLILKFTTECSKSKHLYYDDF